MILNHLEIQTNSIISAAKCGVDFFKPPILISCYVCSFIVTTGKEHDNLFRRVCLPSASNYRKMRRARPGFVLKVNILYIEAYPALERFLLSTK